MRARFGKGIVVIVNASIVIIFCLGLYINLTYSDISWLGVMCQVISLLYTIIFGFLSIVKNEDKDYTTPYFTDRKEVLQYVIQNLYEIVYEGNSDQFITINCLPQDGVGKTELLLKLCQILKNTSIAKQYLSSESYCKYRKVKSRFGMIHFVQYQNESTITLINELPYILFKKNIVIVDDMPQGLVTGFDNKFIIICCQPAQEKVQMNTAYLKRFSKEDLKQFYMAKFQTEPTESFLSRAIEYTQGNIELISKILSSLNTCKLFENSFTRLYEISYYIQKGEYQKAQTILDRLKGQAFSELGQDQEYQYRMDYLTYDLLHYKNQYVKALEGFESLYAKNLSNPDHLNELLERLSHINKHMGQFETALGNALHLKNQQVQNSKVLSLYYLLYDMDGDNSWLSKAEDTLCKMSENEALYIPPEKAHYYTYQAVMFIYKYKYGAAHKAIDEAIAYYESSGNKYITNCYFIKGEIYRFDQNHEKACEYYQKCLNTYKLNGDLDVYTLAYALLIYEKSINGVTHQFHQDYSLEQVKEFCVELEMAYNRKLVFALDELLKAAKDLTRNRDLYNQQKAYFDSHVFFIP